MPTDVRQWGWERAIACGAARTQAVAAALGAVMLCATPALGQSGDAIPRELVLALLGVGTRGDREVITVGRVADGLPTGVIPDGAEVLGSLVRAGQSTTVFAVAEEPTGARRAMEERLRATGFAPPPSSSASRGFVSTGGAAAMTTAYCRGEEGIWLRTQRRATTGALVVLSHMGSREGGMCSPPSARTMLEGIPIPALEPPEGFRAQSSGSGGGDNEWSLRVRLIGRGTPNDVVRHYSDQLVASGWMTTEREGAASVALQLLRRESNGRVVWSAVLGATGDGSDGPIDVFLNLRKR